MNNPTYPHAICLTDKDSIEKLGLISTHGMSKHFYFSIETSRLQFHKPLTIDIFSSTPQNYLSGISATNSISIVWCIHWLHILMNSIQRLSLSPICSPFISLIVSFCGKTNYLSHEIRP